MDEGSAIDESELEIGDCEVIVIGFEVEYVESDPPLLYSIKPIVTTYDSYTDS